LKSVALGREEGSIVTPGLREDSISPARGQGPSQRLFQRFRRIVFHRFRGVSGGFRPSERRTLRLSGGSSRRSPPEVWHVSDGSNTAPVRRSLPSTSRHCSNGRSLVTDHTRAYSGGDRRELPPERRTSPFAGPKRRKLRESRWKTIRLNRWNNRCDRPLPSGREHLSFLNPGVTIEPSSSERYAFQPSCATLFDRRLQRSTGSAWAFLSPPGPLVHCFRFRLRDYSGPEAVLPSLFAVLFYGCIGGFPLLAVLVLLAGSLRTGSANEMRRRPSVLLCIRPPGGCCGDDGPGRPRQIIGPW